MDAPVATYSDDFYRFSWSAPTGGVEMTMESFVERSNDIQCELTVTYDDPLYGGELYSGRLLLLGPNSLRDVRNIIAGRVEGPPWAEYLDAARKMARVHYRIGSPVIDLASVNLNDRISHLVPPFIADNAISMLYGLGGTAKSTIALAVGLMISTGVEIAGLYATRLCPVLYLDWEDDEEVHAERLRALCATLGIETPTDMMLYKRCAASLPESVRTIRRAIAEAGAGFVVVDSVGMAAPNLDSDGIIATMRSMRQLGVPALALHHLAKDAKDKKTPFGSVYSSNAARTTWLIERDEDSPDPIVAITHSKVNGGRLIKTPFAYRIDFENVGDELQGISITATSINNVSTVRKAMQPWKHIKELLLANSEPLTVGDMQDALAIEGMKLSEGAIRAALNRQTQTFTKVGTRSLPTGRPEVTWGVQHLNA